MSDLVDGSADAGNPAPEAAPVAPAPEAAPAAAPAAPAADTPFYSTFESEDLRGFVENKGVKEPEQLASMYHNLEKMFGADKADRTVVLPGPDADEASMAEFYNKLGRPETPDAYELPVPEGDSGDMAAWASGVFHEAGLSAKQAAMVAEKWNGRIAELASGQQAEAEQTAAQAEAELRREWGAAYDQKMNGMDATAAALGMETEHLLGLRNAMGPAAALRFVDQLASKLGEDMVVNGESAEAAHTPAAALSAINAMWADPETNKALMDRGHPQHAEMVAKKSALARQAAAGRG